MFLTEDESSLSKHSTFSPLLWLFFFYFCALIIAAVWTPPIFNGIVHWNRQSPNAWNTYLLRKGFAIFFDRIRLAAFLLFFPALWAMVGKLNLGRKIFRPFFALGALLVTGIFAIRMLFLDFTVEAPAAFFLVRALASALLIGVLEEWLFRGIIFRLLLEKLRPPLAIVLSAFIFAYFHFRPAYALATIGEATFSDGFRCCYEVIFHSLVGISWFKFSIIFFLGYLLAAVYFRVGRLGAAMGLHAGIIFSLTIFKGCIFFPTAHSFLGSNDLFDSPLALGVIIFAIILNKWRTNRF
jgi:membrane protease YdiL (CAAX protease family)